MFCISSSFVERHSSINEEEDPNPAISPPILKLKRQPSAASANKKPPATQTVSAPNILVFQPDPPPPSQDMFSNRPLSPPYDHIEAIDGSDGGGETNVTHKKNHTGHHHHSDRPIPQYGEIVVLG